MNDETPEDIKKLVASSWARKTQASYNSELKKYFTFCANRGIDPYKPTFDTGLQFLVWLHQEQKANYSTLASARTVMSNFISPEGGTTFGSNPLVRGWG